MLLDLDPRDLEEDDLSNAGRNWIFSFATASSLRWLFPGMVRVAFEQKPPQPHLFFEFITQRTSDTFTEPQWIVILDLAEFCFEAGWISRSDIGYLGPGACRNEKPEGC